MPEDNHVTRVLSYSPQKLRKKAFLSEVVPPGTTTAPNWDQDHIDATFHALVCDLAGAPHELINTTTGVIEGYATQTLYGTRTWTGAHTSPLLFAGQYEDAESGWVYNRFRYYNPTLGAYNAQDPLGLAPRLASAQGYVDHASYWVDVFGLKAHKVSLKELTDAGVPKADRKAVQAWLNGRDTDAYIYSYLDKSDENMQYIGMTKDLDARALQHADRFGSPMTRFTLDESKLSDGANALTRRQSRSFEELGIDTLGMQKDGGQLLNARHEISPSGTASPEMRQGALKWAKHMISTGAVRIAGLSI